MSSFRSGVKILSQVSRPQGCGLVRVRSYSNDDRNSTPYHQPTAEQFNKPLQNTCKDLSIQSKPKPIKSWFSLFKKEEKPPPPKTIPPKPSIPKKNELSIEDGIVKQANQEITEYQSDISKEINNSVLCQNENQNNIPQTMQINVPSLQEENLSSCEEQPNSSPLHDMPKPVDQNSIKETKFLDMDNSDKLTQPQNQIPFGSKIQHKITFAECKQLMIPKMNYSKQNTTELFSTKVCAQVPKIPLLTKGQKGKMVTIKKQRNIRSINRDKSSDILYAQGKSLKRPDKANEKSRGEFLITNQSGVGSLKTKKLHVQLSPRDKVSCQQVTGEINQKPFNFNSKKYKSLFHDVAMVNNSFSQELKTSLIMTTKSNEALKINDNITNMQNQQKNFERHLVHQVLPKLEKSTLDLGTDPKTEKLAEQPLEKSSEVVDKTHNIKCIQMKPAYSSGNISLKDNKKMNEMYQAKENRNIKSISNKITSNNQYYRNKNKNKFELLNARNTSVKNKTSSLEKAESINRSSIDPSYSDLKRNELNHSEVKHIKEESKHSTESEDSKSPDLENLSQSGNKEMSLLASDTHNKELIRHKNESIHTGLELNESEKLPKQIVDSTIRSKEFKSAKSQINSSKVDEIKQMLTSFTKNRKPHSEFGNCSEDITFLPPLYTSKIIYENNTIKFSPRYKFNTFQTTGYRAYSTQGFDRPSSRAPRLEKPPPSCKNQSGQDEKKEMCEQFNKTTCNSFSQKEAAQGKSCKKYQSQTCNYSNNNQTKPSCIKHQCVTTCTTTGPRCTKFENKCVNRNTSNTYISTLPDNKCVSKVPCSTISNPEIKCVPRDTCIISKTENKCDSKYICSMTVTSNQCGNEDRGKLQFYKLQKPSPACGKQNCLANKSEKCSSGRSYKNSMECKQTPIPMPIEIHFTDLSTPVDKSTPSCYVENDTESLPSSKQYRFKDSENLISIEINNNTSNLKNSQYHNIWSGKKHNRPLLALLPEKKTEGKIHTEIIHSTEKHIHDDNIEQISLELKSSYYVSDELPSIHEGHLKTKVSHQYRKQNLHGDKHISTLTTRKGIMGIHNTKQIYNQPARSYSDYRICDPNTNVAPMECQKNSEDCVKVPFEQSTSKKKSGECLKIKLPGCKQIIATEHCKQDEKVKCIKIPTPKPCFAECSRDPLPAPRITECRKEMVHPCKRPLKDGSYDGCKPPDRSRKVVCPPKREVKKPEKKELCDEKDETCVKDSEKKNAGASTQGISSKDITCPSNSFLGPQKYYFPKRYYSDMKIYDTPYTSNLLNKLKETSIDPHSGIKYDKMIPKRDIANVHNGNHIQFDKSSLTKTIFSGNSSIKTYYQQPARSYSDYQICDPSINTTPMECQKKKDECKKLNFEKTTTKKEGECTKLTLPGCKTATVKQDCKLKVKKECTRILTPKFSYAECAREPIPPLRITECSINKVNPCEPQLKDGSYDGCNPPDRKKKVVCPPKRQVKKPEKPDCTEKHQDECEKTKLRPSTQGISSKGISCPSSTFLRFQKYYFPKRYFSDLKINSEFPSCLSIQCQSKGGRKKNDCKKMSFDQDPKQKRKNIGECKNINLPGCSQVTPTVCESKTQNVDCIRIPPPMPSYSECLKDNPPERRFTECNLKRTEICETVKKGHSYDGCNPPVKIKKELCPVKIKDGKDKEISPIEIPEKPRIQSTHDERKGQDECRKKQAGPISSSSMKCSLGFSIKKISHFYQLRCFSDMKRGSDQSSCLSFPWKLHASGMKNGEKCKKMPFEQDPARNNKLEGECKNVNLPGCTRVTSIIPKTQPTCILTSEPSYSECLKEDPPERRFTKCNLKRDPTSVMVQRGISYDGCVPPDKFKSDLCPFKPKSNEFLKATSNTEQTKVRSTCMEKKKDQCFQKTTRSTIQGSSSTYMNYSSGTCSASQMLYSCHSQNFPCYRDNGSPHINSTKSFHTLCVPLGNKSSKYHTKTEHPYRPGLTLNSSQCINDLTNLVQRPYSDSKKSPDKCDEVDEVKTNMQASKTYIKKKCDGNEIVKQTFVTCPKPPSIEPKYKCPSKQTIKPKHKVDDVLVVAKKTFVECKKPEVPKIKICEEEKVVVVAKEIVEKTKKGWKPFIECPQPPTPPTIDICKEEEEKKVKIISEPGRCKCITVPPFTQCPKPPIKEITKCTDAKVSLNRRRLCNESARSKKKVHYEQKENEPCSPPFTKCNNSDGKNNPQQSRSLSTMSCSYEEWLLNNAYNKSSIIHKNKCCLYPKDVQCVNGNRSIDTNSQPFMAKVKIHSLLTTMKSWFSLLNAEILCSTHEETNKRIYDSLPIQLKESESKKKYIQNETEKIVYLGSKCETNQQRNYMPSQDSDCKLKVSKVLDCQKLSVPKSYFSECNMITVKNSSKNRYSEILSATQIVQEQIPKCQSMPSSKDKERETQKAFPKLCTALNQENIYRPQQTLVMKEQSRYVSIPNFVNRDIKHKPNIYTRDITEKDVIEDVKGDNLIRCENVLSSKAERTRLTKGHSEECITEEKCNLNDELQNEDTEKKKTSSQRNKHLITQGENFQCEVVIRNSTENKITEVDIPIAEIDEMICENKAHGIPETSVEADVLLNEDCTTAEDKIIHSVCAVKKSNRHIMNVFKTMLSEQSTKLKSPCSENRVVQGEKSTLMFCDGLKQQSNSVTQNCDHVFQRTVPFESCKDPLIISKEINSQSHLLVDNMNHSLNQSTPYTSTKNYRPVNTQEHETSTHLNVREDVSSYSNKNIPLIEREDEIYSSYYTKSTCSSVKPVTLLKSPCILDKLSKRKYHSGNSYLCCKDEKYKNNNNEAQRSTNSNEANDNGTSKKKEVCKKMRFICPIEETKPPPTPSKEEKMEPSDIDVCPPSPDVSIQCSSNETDPTKSKETERRAKKIGPNCDKHVDSTQTREESQQSEEDPFKKPEPDIYPRKKEETKEPQNQTGKQTELDICPKKKEESKEQESQTEKKLELDICPKKKEESKVQETQKSKKSEPICSKQKKDTKEPEIQTGKKPELDIYPKKKEETPKSKTTEPIFSKQKEDTKEPETQTGKKTELDICPKKKEESKVQETQKNKKKEPIFSKQKEDSKEPETQTSKKQELDICPKKKEEILKSKKTEPIRSKQKENTTEPHPQASKKTEPKCSKQKEENKDPQTQKREGTYKKAEPVYSKQNDKTKEPQTQKGEEEKVESVWSKQKEESTKQEDKSKESKPAVRTKQNDETKKSQEEPEKKSSKNIQETQKEEQKVTEVSKGEQEKDFPTQPCKSKEENPKEEISVKQKEKKYQQPESETKTKEFPVHPCKGLKKESDEENKNIKSMEKKNSSKSEEYKESKAENIGTKASLKHDCRAVGEPVSKIAVKKMESPEYTNQCSTKNLPCRASEPIKCKKWMKME